MQVTKPVNFMPGFFFPDKVYKIGVHKNLTKFTGNHPYWSYFFVKAAGYVTAIVSPSEFTKVFRVPFL